MTRRPLPLSLGVAMRPAASPGSPEVLETPLRLCMVLTDVRGLDEPKGRKEGNMPRKGQAMAVLEPTVRRCVKACKAGRSARAQLAAPARG